MPLVHNCVQFLGQYLFDDISVGLYDFACDFAALVEDVINGHFVEIDKDAVSVS